MLQANLFMIISLQDVKASTFHQLHLCSSHEIIHDVKWNEIPGGRSCPVLCVSGREREGVTSHSTKSRVETRRGDMNGVRIIGTCIALPSLSRSFGLLSSRLLRTIFIARSSGGSGKLPGEKTKKPARGESALLPRKMLNIS